MKFSANELKSEIWRDAVIYDDYMVSSLGRIQSKERIIKYKDGREYLKTKEYKTISLAKNGYYHTMLRYNGKNIYMPIHKLVAMSFLNHIPSKYKIVVDHKDNNKLNNKVENLCLISQRKNTSKDIKNKTSLYTGVRRRKNRNYTWEVCIYINPKRIFLGGYNCELQASKVYNSALSNIDKYNGNNKEFRDFIKKSL